VAWRFISKQILLIPYLSVLDTRRHFSCQADDKQMNRTIDDSHCTIVIMMQALLHKDKLFYINCGCLHEKVGIRWT
jgi:hypothetical protein